MSGIQKGVLCVQEVIKTDLVRNVMNFIFALVNLIKFPPKRLTLFDICLGGK